MRRAPWVMCTALIASSPAPLAPVPAPPPTRPSLCNVQIHEPSEGRMLYGVTDLAARVECPEGTSPATVAFFVDGRPAGERTQPPYAVTWDAGGGFAAHLVEARLVDRSGRRSAAFVLTRGALMQESVQVTATPIDLVELSISVTDGAGHPVRGLAPADFVVTEAGRMQKLSTAHPEDRPLSLAVLIDVSSSMRLLWPRLREAAPALATTLRPGDAMKLIAFSGPARLVQDFTSDARLVGRSMGRFREWGGGTSLYDTLAAVGTELAWSRGGRQAVVLVTDGVDTLSRIDVPRLRNFLRRTDLVVETFLLRAKVHDVPAPPGKYEREMERLCRDTGGTLIKLEDTSGMTAAFKELGVRLQDRYYLAYQSDQAAQDGWKSIEVTVRRPDSVVRARSSVIGRRPVGGFLIEEMTSKDPAVREKAAEWLGAMPAQGAGEALLQALDDRSPGVRRAAARSLGQIREPRAIEPLIERLRDRDPVLRDAAAEGLHQFGPAAVPALVAALETDHGPGRGEALEVLAAIGDARAVEAIERLAARPAPLARTPDGRLPDDTPEERRVRTEFRIDALRALGRIGGTRALPVLSTAARDRQPDVRTAAFAALASLAEPKAFEILKELGQDTQPDAAIRAEARTALVDGFRGLVNTGKAEEFVAQPVGGAVLMFAIDVLRHGPGEAGARGRLIDALGGAEAAAALLERSAGHLLPDKAAEARRMGASLRGDPAQGKSVGG